MLLCIPLALGQPLTSPTCPVLPYAVEHYNSLPELREAKDQLISSGASGVLFTEIGPGACKTPCRKILGVILHNHFRLSHDEKLVDFGSVAVPCAEELPNVNASSWRFTDEAIAPYEFVRSAGKISLTHS